MNATNALQKSASPIQKLSLANCFALLLLISLGSVGAVLFTPGLPAMADYFGITNINAQLVISIFLIGYAVGQLVYGPVANAYGRKRALYLGLCLHTAGALGCAICSEYHLFAGLLLARGIMSIGSAVGLTLTFTLIQDIYHAQLARKMTALFALSFAVMPGIAIALGGFLVSSFGWIACFYFLSAYGFMMIIICAPLPETLPKASRMPIQFNRLCKGYQACIQDKQLIKYATLAGLTTTMVYIYAATSPIVAIEVMHLSPKMFGLFNLIVSIGYITGNLLSAKLSKSMQASRVMSWGLLIIGLALCCLLLGTKTHYLSPLALFVPISILYLGIPFIYTNSMVLAQSNCHDKSNAASLSSFINMAFPVAGTLLIGKLPITVIYMIPVSFLFIYAWIALILFKKTSVPGITNPMD